MLYGVVPTPAAFDEMQRAGRASHRIRCFASRVTCTGTACGQRTCAAANAHIHTHTAFEAPRNVPHHIRGQRAVEEVVVVLVCAVGDTEVRGEGGIRR